MKEMKYGPNFWLTVILALAAVVSAYYAYKNVQLMTDTRKLEIESQRPYFSIPTPVVHFDKLRGNHVRTFFKNIGARPAVNIRYVIYKSVFPKNGNVLPVSEDEQDELAPGEGTGINSENYAEKLEEEMLYYVVAIKYQDPLTHKKYSQISYSQLDGGDYNRHIPGLANVPKKIRDQLKEQFKDELRDFSIVAN